MSGLNQSTKDYFINLINRQIDEKINALKGEIKTEAVETEIFNRWLEENHLLDIYNKFLKLDAEYERIHVLRNNQESLLKSAYADVTGKYIGYGFSAGNIRQNTLVNEAVDNGLRLRHPEQFAEIDKLNKIKQNVEAVVLLQTSPTRLQDALKGLLEKYGVEVIGMEDGIL